MRNSTEIRVWLLRQGILQKEIAQHLGIDLSLVYRTIDGERNNRRVLARLRELGCPEHLL